MYEIVNANDKKVFIVCGKTDLRKGIDGLAGLIQDEFDVNAYSPAMFLFCGNRTDRFKILSWNIDGFSLIYKRLENRNLKWPRKPEKTLLELSKQEFHLLLEGFNINKI